MNPRLKLLWVYFVLVLLILGGQAYYHETAHVSISRNVGGCNATIEFSNFCGVFTKVSDCSFDDPERNKMQLELNAWNEIIGYNSLWIILGIISGAFLISLAILERPAERRQNGF